MPENAEARTPEQLVFQEWLATPKKQRVPKTQVQLAEKLGVDDTTLSRWKKLEGWQAEVNAIARRYLSDDLPAIYEALAKEAKKGSAPHIKLALESVGEYVERKDITSGGKPIVSPQVYLPAVAAQGAEDSEAG